MPERSRHAGVRRVCVHGASGSGKTTLARALAAALGVPHVELDAIFHQPDWKDLETEEFRRVVGELAVQDDWVIDGNYRAVRDLVWSRAELIVVIDRSRSRTMLQLLRRTLVRLLRRQVLWNGNREAARDLFSRDPKRNLLLWSWNTHDRYREEVPTAARAALGPDRVEIVTSQHDARRLVASLSHAAGD